MMRKMKMIAALAAITVCGAFAAGAMASSLTPTKVTIQGPQGDFYGYVHSSDQANCELNRNVVVYKMLGSTPDPHVDQKIASDIAQPNGPDSMWSVGNTGYKHGNFYAKVKKTSLCTGAISKVLSE